ncbi:MAG: hypothetical protein IPP61_21780 [Cytophagaceae bacterium]|nr:hypothetical protein [Cytophagaceae bacterium]MBK9934363.1 hypothetical protein [Cytophagaceae bacterium]MBL0300811.1 hypothetical protein [Cytophagaceae bacterium]MBL0327754.1 hypothetical protein [Cytophagaceae bacterium]
MTKISFNVPDGKVNQFIEFMQKFPSDEISLVDDFVLTDDVLRLLEESSKVPFEECIDRNQLNARLNGI